MLLPTTPETLPSGVTFMLQRQTIVLSKSCANERDTDGECTHETVADWALTVTFVIDEDTLAVQKL